MVEIRLSTSNPDLSLEEIRHEARNRWLRPAEIYKILQNYQRFEISTKPADRPPSGTFFLYDKKVLRNFRKDGHSWRKKRDGKIVQEAHEKLKVHGVDALQCYYAHGEENGNFQRRTYWQLEVEFIHIALVHYLEVENNKASYIQTRGVEEHAKVSHLNDSPACSNSLTIQSLFPSQNTITEGPVNINTWTSEHEESESAGNYQASSRHYSYAEMQQYGNELMNSTYFSNPYVPISTLNGQYGHQMSQYSVAQEDITGVFDETGIGLALGSKTVPVDSTSWEEVLEHIRTGSESAPFDSAVFSSLGYIPDNFEQCSFMHAHSFTNDLGSTLQDVTYIANWQRDNAEAGPILTSPDLNAEVDLSLKGDCVYAPLLEQISLDPLNTEVSALEKYDSFNRWMSNELCNVDDLHLDSASGSDWRSIENENAVNSSLTNQEQIDSCLVGPSISQEQLFSIDEFSPTWAYSGMETKVLITGKFSKPTDVEKYMWSCMFGEIEVQAITLSDGTLSCNAPPQKAGRVHFYITCSNRLACSEVREFKYQELNEMDLYMRLEKLLSFENPELASGITSEKQILVSEINVLMAEVNDSWFSILTQSYDDPEVLMKGKLHAWLIQKVVEDGKGPNILDKEGQGVIHLVTALGYDWAILPTITAGIAVGFRDVHGWSALHWAAYCGRERTIATLLEFGADSRALTDPTSEFPLGIMPAELASINGHKGIAGFLAESSLYSLLYSLTLEDSQKNELAIKNTTSRSATEHIGEASSLKRSMSAVRNATQAFGRIHQVFRLQSFHRKKLIEYGDDKCQVSIDHTFSQLSMKLGKTGKHDLSVHNYAATTIQNKFRGWKKRKEFLTLRQKVIKLQAHVRGHLVRRKLKIYWPITVVQALIRWRSKGQKMACWSIDGNSKQSQTSKKDDSSFYVLKEGGKQTEVRNDIALARVQSMLKYPEARDQYRRLRLLIQEPKDKVMNNVEDLVTELESWKSHMMTLVRTN